MTFEFRRSGNIQLRTLASRSSRQSRGQGQEKGPGYLFLRPGTTEEYLRRMLKKAVQQGRSERRGEAYASVR